MFTWRDIDELDHPTEVDRSIPNKEYCRTCDDACSQPAKQALTGLQSFWKFKTALIRHLTVRHKALCTRKGYSMDPKVKMSLAVAEHILKNEKSEDYDEKDIYQYNQTFVFLMV